MASGPIVILGTLDTKAAECRFVRSAVEALGGRTLLVDVSCLHASRDPDIDVSASEVTEAAGLAFPEVAASSRRDAVGMMGRGASVVLRRLAERGGLAGVVTLGGANGSLLAVEALSSLPLGLPKVLVSVVGATDLTALVGTRDITVINAVCDISLNAITRPIFRQAAAAVLGMATVIPEDHIGRSTVAMSVLGVTQPASEACRLRLDAQGHEVAAFHANGIGGRAMEAVIGEGRIARVVELTPSELINHLVGGVFSAGETRMDGAIAHGLPLVVAPGAIDFVNLWAERVPERFQGRRFLRYTQQNTLMRTTREEIAAFGTLVAAKMNRLRRPGAVAIPAGGFSRFDHPDGPDGCSLQGEVVGPWYDPDADEAFGEALRADLRTDLVRVVSVRRHINDPEFAEALIDLLDDVSKWERRAG